MQVGQIRSFTSEQEFNLLQSRQQLFAASDQLKALIYAPDLPLAGEDLILP